MKRLKSNPMWNNPGSFPPGGKYKKSARAFTLVETAIAIGIVSFALVGLMGVFPIALTELGNARNNVVVAELAEASLARASSMDFKSLATLDQTSKLYDLAGVETTQPGRAVYEVQLTVTNATSFSQALIVRVYRAPHKPTSSPLAEFVSVLSDNGR